MKTHKDLPGGSQAWAGDVDALLAEVKVLREVVKRLAQNAGLDYSTPQRGLNVGNTPSIKNPVGQKLSSLADVSSYNVAEGQVLSWSQQGQRWLPVTLPSASGAIDIPEEIAWFTDATGYGYLPTVTDDPYSVLAQNPSVLGLGAGAFNLTAHDGRGDGSTQSVRANYGHVYMSNESDTGYGAVGIDPSGRITATSTTGTGSSQVDMNGGEWELGYNNGTSDASRIYSYGFTSMKIQDDAGVEIIGPYFKPPGCFTVARPTTLGPADKGAHVYDYDLKIPIWWNGTIWTNALGTAV